MPLAAGLMATVLSLFAVILPNRVHIIAKIIGLNRFLKKRLQYAQSSHHHEMDARKNGRTNTVMECRAAISHNYCAPHGRFSRRHPKAAHSFRRSEERLERTRCLKPGLGSAKLVVSFAKGAGPVCQSMPSRLRSGQPVLVRARSGKDATETGCNAPAVKNMGPFLRQRF